MVRRAFDQGLQSIAVQGFEDDPLVANEFAASHLGQYLANTVGIVSTDSEGKLLALVNPSTDLSDDLVVDPLISELPDDEEPEWMKLSTVCPAPAGSLMIRDVRAWHGGTPNLSNTTRAIPNLEFYAPWFQEPTVPGITYQAYKKLSPRAQELTRYAVADSSEALITGPTLRAP